MAQRPLDSPSLNDMDVACHAARAEGHARLARDVHDDLGGDLAAIKMALSVLMRHIPAQAQPLHEQAEYVDGLVDRAIDTMHRLSDDTPPLEKGQSLSTALVLRAAEFARLSGIACSFSEELHSSEEASLAPLAVKALLRIAREALVNIGKHAGATKVTLRLGVTGGIASLEIEDDGKGMQDADRVKPDSYGIRGMMQRARAAGGTLSITTVMPHGTLIKADVPCGSGT